MLCQRHGWAGGKLECATGLSIYMHVTHSLYAGLSGNPRSVHCHSVTNSVCEQCWGGGEQADLAVASLSSSCFRLAVVGKDKQSDESWLGTE